MLHQTAEGRSGNHSDNRPNNCNVSHLCIANPYTRRLLSHLNGIYVYTSLCSALKTPIIRFKRVGDVLPNVDLLISLPSTTGCTFT